MTVVPAYSAARAVSTSLEAHFNRNLVEFSHQDKPELATQPNAQTIESIIDASFWASLQREEGYSPKISLAYLSPAQAGQHLLFEQHLPLNPVSLTRLSPAVERPGIHLGVWHNHEGELCVWGTTRIIPRLCFVLEVIDPGLLVVKYRRGQDSGKFANVLVLNGDQIKEVDEQGTSLSDCPHLLTSMLRFGAPASDDNFVNVLVQLAVSMRTHGRGGSLLVVPQNSDVWRESIVLPTQYSVAPPFSGLANLMRRSEEEQRSRLWQEELLDAVESIAGLTAVDGATVISDEYELLAFGTKIIRRASNPQVEQVIITEPVVGNIASIVHPVQFGGTRHLSAAQFIQDQHDALALVASQDGRFTVFAWSPCENMVHAHRMETLLL